MYRKHSRRLKISDGFIIGHFFLSEIKIVPEYFAGNVNGIFPHMKSTGRGRGFQDVREPNTTVTIKFLFTDILSDFCLSLDA